MVSTYIERKQQKTGRKNKKQWINGKMQAILVEMDELMELRRLQGCTKVKVNPICTLQKH